MELMEGAQHTTQLHQTHSTPWVWLDCWVWGPAACSAINNHQINSTPTTQTKSNFFDLCLVVGLIDWWVVCSACSSLAPLPVNSIHFIKSFILKEWFGMKWMSWMGGADPLSLFHQINSINSLTFIDSINF